MSQTLSGSRYELHVTHQGAAEGKARDYFAVHPADLEDDAEDDAEELTKVLAAVQTKAIERGLYVS